jgi:hypothetical protein
MKVLRASDHGCRGTSGVGVGDVSMARGVKRESVESNYEDVAFKV